MVIHWVGLKVDSLLSVVGRRMVVEVGRGKVHEEVVAVVVGVRRTRVPHARSRA